jgi:hypothetical protein
MTRSLLQPLRTRRPVRHSSSNHAELDVTSLSPGTRKTLATIGALWVSFAASASAVDATSRNGNSPASRSAMTSQSALNSPDAPSKDVCLSSVSQ